MSPHGSSAGSCVIESTGHGLTGRSPFASSPGFGLEAIRGGAEASWRRPYYKECHGGRRRTCSISLPNIQPPTYEDRATMEMEGAMEPSVASTAADRIVARHTGE